MELHQSRRADKCPHHQHLFQLWKSQRLDKFLTLVLLIQFHDCRVFHANFVHVNLKKCGRTASTSFNSCSMNRIFCMCCILLRGDKVSFCPWKLLTSIMEGVRVLEGYPILCKALKTRGVELNWCLFTNLSTHCMYTQGTNGAEVSTCTWESREETEFHSGTVHHFCHDDCEWDDALS